MITINLSPIVLFALGVFVSAAPTSQVDEFPNMVILIRNSMNEGFVHSPAMADQVKSEIRSGLCNNESTEVVTESLSIVSKSPDIDA